MAASAPPPDSNIDGVVARQYWSTISPDVNGMLGGYPQISRIDLQGSANFLAKLRRHSSSTQETLPRAVDCGAGIGRVTKGFLVKACQVVDIVEPIEKFVREMEHGEDFKALRDEGKMGRKFVAGLEEWEPPSDYYDLIWNQWCVGQLTDAQLVAYLTRCRGALKQGGWIVVKENLSTEPEGTDIFDELDSSVTR